ncbi:hypothetical protein H2200_006756 [Cladophialophora chaetospira]|uniref:SnoaL-like domain-containing protein n=1 Tax=Cladophialophora chaetospira TaxID=386627 RepID=A0AA39CHZ5_9EURO|nr:hypothetical protein H2200_006756 [Cladophialophora chaetospira]
MSATNTLDTVHTSLKQLYHSYRHTEYIPSKAKFFSPTLMQVCRPIPNFSALNRDTVILYLINSAGFDDLESYERAQLSPATRGITTESTDPEAATDKATEAAPGIVKVKALSGKNYYSIRPLESDEESEIPAEDVVAPLGMTPAQLNEMRQKEDWVGMRVDLWDDDSDGKGPLIRVKYWWRKENVNGEEEWLQCLHDIMSIGERDGTEGEGGQVLE